MLFKDEGGTLVDVELVVGATWPSVAVILDWLGDVRCEASGASVRPSVVSLPISLGGPVP